MKIALDIMGGDLAPYSNIEGAFSYIEGTKDSETQLLLVGDKPIIEKEISKYPQYDDNIKIIHTTSDFSFTATLSTTCSLYFISGCSVNTPTVTR